MLYFKGYISTDKDYLYIYPSQQIFADYEDVHIGQISIHRDVVSRLDINHHLSHSKKIQFSGQEDSLLIYLDLLELIASSKLNYQIRLEIMLKKFFQSIQLSFEKNVFSEQQALEIEKYLTDNLHESLRIIELSKKIGINQQYFKIQFKNTFDTTVHDYIKTMRLDKAVQLLNETSLSVREIATSIGYSSTSSFSQAFKSKFGKSPLTLKISKI